MMVPKHGITYFLGDMGLASNDLLRSVITKLNGTKIIVRGNHDGNMYSMYNAGFDVVVDKAQIPIGKYIVTMTHCPLKGVFREDVTGMRNCDPNDNWHKESQHKNKFSIEDFGQFHLHGHTHARGMKANGKPVKDGRQWDVSVCGNKYKPVPINAVEAWIADYNKNKATHNLKIDSDKLNLCDCGNTWDMDGICSNT